MVVKLYFFEEEKDMNEKPRNFDDFLSWIQNFYGYADIDKFFFEYTLDGNKYFQLNQGTYNTFYNSNNPLIKIYIHLTIEESHYYTQEKKEENEIKEEKEVNSENINKIEFVNEKMDDIKNNNIESENNIESNNNNNIDNIIIKEEEIKEENNKNKEEKKEENNIEEEKEEEINTESNEIKLPEITKDMVIASIIKQVKERRQQSKIQLEKERKEKEKKEREKRKKEKEKKKQEKKEKKNDFAGEISNLINNQIENFKKELINESNIKLNQIITESQIQLQKDFPKEKINYIHSMEVHPNIQCSKCGVNPIKGNRYYCAFCININFCDKCEEEIGFAHGHPLYKFKLRLA